MKSRLSALIVFIISFTLAGLVLSACGNKNESTKETPEVTGKTIEALENFKGLETQANPEGAMKIIKEVSGSLPTVVASVNGVKISSDPVKAALKRVELQVSHQNQEVDREQLNSVIKRILDMEIEREVLFQQGEILKIEVSDEDVNQILDIMKSRYDSEEKFHAEFSKSGMTMETLKGQISRNIIVSKLIKEQVQDKIEISDQNAMDFYIKNGDSFKKPETMRASHILIKVAPEINEKDKKAAMKKAGDILKKAKAGEDFAELAKKYSEGPSASRGGDLNDVAKGQMVKEFEEGLFNLKVGEVSEIVTTRFGYHIIKAFSKSEGGGLVPFDQVKEKISNYLKESESQQKTKAYLDGLLKKAKIERFI